MTCQVFGFGNARHLPTSWRTALISEVCSYCGASAESPLPSSKTICCCSVNPLRFFGFGIGEMNSAHLLVSIIRCVGGPLYQAPSGASVTRKASSVSGVRRMRWSYSVSHCITTVGEKRAYRVFILGAARAFRTGLRIRAQLVRTLWALLRYGK